MTTTAAERLREYLTGWGGHPSAFTVMLDQALADERRATVERIRKIALEVHHPDSWFIAQLDAEADR